MNEKIKELFGKEEFMTKFNATESPEDIKALLNEYGVELSEEELKDMINAVLTGADDGEISIEDLENVNGGVVATMAVILAGSWKFAVQTYGSEANAVRAIGTYWARKLGYRG